MTGWGRYGRKPVCIIGTFVEEISARQPAHDGLGIESCYSFRPVLIRLRINSFLYYGGPFVVLCIGKDLHQQRNLVVGLQKTLAYYSF